MNYLDAWNRGYEDGQAQQLKLINEHCDKQFDNIQEVIMFINEVEVTDVQS
jgi:phosphoribosyl-AMP cyclohydrolase